MRKPEADIYQHVLAAKTTAAADAVFFDDHPANVLAQALGIKTVHVTDRDVVPGLFCQ